MKKQNKKNVPLPKGFNWNEVERCHRCRNLERLKSKCVDCDGLGFVKIKTKLSLGKVD